MKKAAEPKADALNDRVNQQAHHAPVVPDTAEGPRRRTWEGYAADYHELSERLVEALRAQAETLAQVEVLSKELASKDAELRRIRVQRLKDLDRLAAVSRTRDLLEKRSSAQMAKVAAALTQPAHSAALPAQQEVQGTAGFPAPAGQPTLETLVGPVPSWKTNTVPDVGEPADQPLSWAERRWWAATIKMAQAAHKKGRFGYAIAAFEVALRVRQTASLWEQYGHVLRENGAFPAAEVAYERALAMQPGKAEVMFLAGYCLEMVGRGADAAAKYEAALTSDPALETRYDHLRGFRARLVP